MKRLSPFLLAGILMLCHACSTSPATIAPQPEEPSAVQTDTLPASPTESSILQTEESDNSIQSTVDIQPTKHIEPDAFTYLGAFRLPYGGDRPLTFEYSAGAMAFYPDGDPAGSIDGFPGSLYITGHDRLPYGELPDGGQVGEVTIPPPIISKDPAALNQAEFLQDFHNVAKGFFVGLDEIPRVGLTFMDTPLTGPRLHITWGQHFQPEQPAPSHAWFNLDLSNPQMQGAWFIADQLDYSVNGYLFEIPQSWADSYANGRVLATGRYRDGGWSGMGPALFAYRPWDDSGNPAAPDTQLAATTLLLYESSLDSEDFDRALADYQHADEWEGGAWLSTADSRTAVLFAGTKGTGEKFWYGFVDPADSQHPCVEVELIGQFTLCRLADGSPCPEQDLSGCSQHNDYRGWWSSRYTAQFILYDPADLAQVATGSLQSWAPQPYAVIDIDEYMLNNPAGVEPEMLGTGDQRRFRLGEVAYDRENGLLYVLELFADEARPVIHVWQIR